jgi:hypothetical protein
MKDATVPLVGSARRRRGSLRHRWRRSTKPPARSVVAREPAGALLIRDARLARLPVLPLREAAVLEAEDGATARAQSEDRDLSFPLHRCIFAGVVDNVTACRTPLDP